MISLVQWHWLMLMKSSPWTHLLFSFRKLSLVQVWTSPDIGRLYKYKNGKLRFICSNMCRKKSIFLLETSLIVNFVKKNILRVLISCERKKFAGTGFFKYLGFNFGDYLDFYWIIKFFGLYCNYQEVVFSIITMKKLV